MKLLYILDRKLFMAYPKKLIQHVFYMLHILRGDSIYVLNKNSFELKDVWI